MSGIISDFDKMSVKDLQNFAKENGLKGFTGLKKQELIAFIVSKAQQAQQAQKAGAEISSVSSKEKFSPIINIFILCFIVPDKTLPNKSKDK